LYPPLSLSLSLFLSLSSLSQKGTVFQIVYHPMRVRFFKYIHRSFNCRVRWC
jgi:hypothetical protein